MISFMEHPHKDEATLASLHPLVREWFVTKFGELSPPQKYSILNIHNGINTLISSPTGSGKTLSAFLAIINNLVIQQMEGTLEQKVYCVYISPLKALANDITKNLKEPLEEIRELAKKQDIKLKVVVGTRTGDTTASQRSSMLKKPPHILITTPESIAIALTTTKFRELLKTTKYVIIDEIHALAENKRGVHMSLSMERFEELIREDDPTKTLIRIGLSATVSPLEEIAKYLVGLEDPDNQLFRPCQIVDVSAIKKMDLKVLCPVNDIMRATYDEMQSALYAMLHDLIQQHKTTLVFTNTRSATERVVHHLKRTYPKHYTGIVDGDVEEEKAEAGLIGAHHGSLSKTHRLSIENRLKEGKLKAVVCSTSLELGIDIGSIDLVILLGSPKSVARALQRIGRSGHKLRETAMGRIIVLDRDDMVECSILLKSAIERKIDRVHIPQNALDVLAQQLFGLAIEKVRTFGELSWIVRRSYCYRTLAKEDFLETMNYLAGEYVSLEQRSVYAKVWWEKETGKVGRRGKLARLIYLTNVGTIPDETNVKVKIGDMIIGTIDEGFLERLSPGDVFVLGGETYEFRFSRGLTAQVKTSAGRPPTVPSWVSEMLPLSFDLSLEIQKFRMYVEEMFAAKRSKKDILEYIDKYLYADSRTVHSVYQYFHEQYSFSLIPHRKRLLVEHYREGQHRVVIVHSLFGRRVNDVLSRSLAYALGRIHKRDIGVAITDNGFSLRSSVPLNMSKALSLVTSKDAPRVMKTVLDKSEVLGRRFRHCASRGLMILRTYKGNSKSVGRQQMNSRLLMSAARKISEDFPILKEAYREVLEDVMDLPSAIQVLKEIEKKQIAIEETTTEVPSPFAFNIVLQGFSDILRMEDRREFLKRMHELVLQQISKPLPKKDLAKEREAFSYEHMWKEAEKHRLAERDEEQEQLAHLAWNLHDTPLFVKQAIIGLLDGKDDVPERVRSGILDHAEEIMRNWPPELVAFVFTQLGIPYDASRLKRDAKKTQLRHDLRIVIKKLKLDEGIAAEAEALIDGREPSRTFWKFINQSLTGTVHKAWSDELVKFLRTESEKRSV